MAKKVKEISAWFEGISDFPKLGGPAQYQFGRSIDHRTDTRAITLLPKALKESGSVVSDLPKWAVTPPLTCGDTFIYGETGNIYDRSSSGSYSFLRQVPNSHGNGMTWFGEDNFLYYTNDKTIGRYGPVCSSNPQFNDDFFGSQGGVRTNTNSLSFVAASSQYASRASTASLQVAGDLTLETQIHPTSLPTTGNTMTFISKWDESGATRSYKFDMTTTSNYFGSGSDGSFTITLDFTDAPVDSACSGTAGTTTLTATNASFSSGQVILIHQTQGTGAGIKQVTKIQSYTAGTITTTDPLNYSYTTGAQVRTVPQYTNVTVNSGKTWSAKKWNGVTGGILAFLCNGTFTNNGTITATGKGFRGGVQSPQGQTTGYQGEGMSGIGIQSTSANGNGGGGSYGIVGNVFAGGGGGNATSGITGGSYAASGIPGVGGDSSGSTDLTTITFGGGGGAAGAKNEPGRFGGAGGDGGGIIFINATTFVNNNIISSDGVNGSLGFANDGAGGGAGAGGSILINCQTAILGTGIIANKAIGGQGPSSIGGDSSYGRLNINYYTSYTGTTMPSINAILDNTLGATDGYILRLQLSSNGSNSETYSKVFTPKVDTWQHVAVVWKSSTSTAEFFLNGISLGTQTGSFASISSNASAFYVGCYKNATVPSGFFDGLMDEVRVWSITKTSVDFLIYMTDQILSTYTGLNAYYQFNNAATDSTAYVNNLTLFNSPLYSTDVPFYGATTRLDMDQSAITAGNTYTVPTTITETASNKLVFTPEKDPQKSIAVQVAAIGTGDWTLTVHDSFNNVVDSKTVVNASMAVGLFEFIFPTVWRPVINQNYHFHLTSTVADGTVTTTTAGDLSTVSFRTYYQFLVTDADFHPMMNFLQFLVVGNERYVGTIEATIYDPHTITLPAGWRVRCFGLWNEYLAIGCWRGSTVSQFDQGRIFFWDGVSRTYNFFIDVPEGAINAMIGSRGKLFFVAGYRAKLLVYEGGSQARKIKNLINSDSTTTIDIYPGAMTMWRALIRIGVGGNVSSSSEEKGVYTFGSINERFADSLSFDNVISTGNYTGDVRIGLTHVVNSKLLIGWQDNVSCGVDYVAIDNPVYADGTVEHLIEDDGAMYHEKETVTITTQFEPILDGQSVQLKYKLNRASDWSLLPAVTTVGTTTTRNVISTGGSRYREYEIGLNLSTTVSTSPTILAISAERDELDTEKRVG